MDKKIIFPALAIAIIALVIVSFLYFNTSSKLNQTEDQASGLQTNLNVVIDPRHFASLDELQSWIADDDTNTKYASSRAIERAYILQVKALREGFILPAYYEIDNSTLYFFNLAYIEGKLYKVSPSNDSVNLIIEILGIEPINAHPLPLN